MASVLDAAIEATPVGQGSRTLKLDRVLARLADVDDFDRLLDMLGTSWGEWGHKQMAGIIRHLCDSLGVEHEDITDKNVEAWRARQAES